MEKDIKENKFVEYAHVHGNIYGTSKVLNIRDFFCSIFFWSKFF